MLAMLREMFSSVRLGIILLAILFVYMSVGSAGIVYPVHPNLFHPDSWVHAQLRQWRPIEMTEFEWFHWWPFQVLLGLIALNMIITTLRRIPLRVVNFGVWGIHCGVLTLIGGSVWYFTMKVEGDSPVARRQVILSVGGESAAIVASPGARVEIGSDAQKYEIEVSSIDPDWEIRSGDDTGKRAYSVTLSITGPKQQFMRQLLAGYPNYTEDMIITGDHKQPVQRAKKVLGTALVDTELVAELDYEPQNWFYLRNDLDKSFAIYLRQPGEGWAQRPIHGMPLYNDYVSSPDLVFQARDEVPLPSDGLDIAVGADESSSIGAAARLGASADPFPEATLRIRGYLRYAMIRSRFRAGGADTPFYPVATLRVSATGGESADYTLEAMDPQRRVADGGLVAFRLVDSDVAFAQLVRPAALRLQIPALALDTTELVRGIAMGKDQLFSNVGPPDSGYSYRVVGLQDDLSVGGKSASVAIVEIKTPKGLTRRWVFDDPSLTRDVPSAEGEHAPMPVADDSVTVEYLPGLGGALVTLVAGPDPDRLRVVTSIGKGDPVVDELSVGQSSLELPAGLTLVLSSYHSHGVLEQKPMVVPQSQRDRDAREMYSMVLVELPTGVLQWLPFHHYVFDNEQRVLRRHPFRPTTVDMGNGKRAELVFSRQRLPLPDPVALDSFALATHIGGYTGEATTIRDYTSMVRFKDADGWSEPVSISVNQPVEHGGLWYFQAQWDPPDSSPPEGMRPSAGLNYTVLGVGNREGVHLQLAGCIIAVLGMIYAFTVKPVLKRRASALAAAASSAPIASVASAGGERVSGSSRGTAAGLLLAFVLATSGASAQSFRDEVNLAPLSELAVQVEGRIKSFGSHANTIMGFVSGPRSIAGQAPEFTYLDMLLRNDDYKDADVIFVKGGSVRAQIASALLRDDPGLAARLKVFESVGLISPALLDRPELQSTLRSMAADLLRTARAMEMIDGARATMHPDSLLARLRIVPPRGDALTGSWRSIAELMPQAADKAAAERAGFSQEPLPDLDPAAQMKASKAWRSLVEGWSRQNAPAVNQAVVDLAAALQECAAGGYPDSARLHWESWYFRSGNLTRIWLVYMIAIILLLLGLVYRWGRALRAGLVLFAIALVLQTGAVGLRWWISQRWPNGNMFEAVTTASWMGSVLALLLEVWLRRTRACGLFALTGAAASMVALMSAHFLPVYLNPNISNLMPVLDDVWLYIHTNVIIFSYALIFMAAVSALGYLGYRACGGPATFARAGGASVVMAPAAPADSRGAVGEVLDGVTMLLMQVAFVMLWSGIVMGAIWADHSWGRPWGWDPKEVFALNTFIVFALLVHVRFRVRDKGLWTAILAVAGAAVMLFNWIVINFIITGLHSYA